MSFALYFSIICDPSDTMAAYVNRGVRFECIYLNCQLFRIRPRVVCIQPCDKFAAAVFECFVVVSLDANIRPTLQYLDEMRMPFAVRTSDIDGCILRTVIPGHYFNWEAR